MYIINTLDAKSRLLVTQLDLSIKGFLVFLGTVIAEVSIYDRVSARGEYK